MKRMVWAWMLGFVLLMQALPTDAHAGWFRPKVDTVVPPTPQQLIELLVRGYESSPSVHAARLLANVRTLAVTPIWQPGVRSAASYTNDTNVAKGAKIRINFANLGPDSVHAYGRFDFFGRWKWNPIAIAALHAHEFTHHLQRWTLAGIFVGGRNRQGRYMDEVEALAMEMSIDPTVRPMVDGKPSERSYRNVLRWAQHLYGQFWEDVVLRDGFPATQGPVRRAVEPPIAVPAPRARLSASVLRGLGQGALNFGGGVAGGLVDSYVTDATQSDLAGIGSNLVVSEGVALGGAYLLGDTAALASAGSSTLAFAPVTVPALVAAHYIEEENKAVGRYEAAHALNAARPVLPGQRSRDQAMDITHFESGGFFGWGYGDAFCRFYGMR